MPPESTVRKWALEDRDGFSAQYATAREIGYQSMADELLDIADDSSGDVSTDEDGNRKFNGEFASLQTAVARLWPHREHRLEIVQLLALLDFGAEAI